MGVPLDAAARARLLAYLHAVLEANRRVNLTAVRDRGDAVVRHLLDSLSCVAVWREAVGATPPRRVLDLGTGGGFPGAVLAVAWPAARVLLIDGRGKKVRGVAHCLAAAGIANAEALQARGADLARLRPESRDAFDLCAARAVGTAVEVLREVAGLVAPGGRVFVMKGPEPPVGEVAAAQREARRRGFAVEPARRTCVPGLDARTVLVYRWEGSA